jgi:hypothetical protein
MGIAKHDRTNTTHALNLTTRFCHKKATGMMSLKKKKEKKKGKKKKIHNLNPIHSPIRGNTLG